METDGVVSLLRRGQDGVRQWNGRRQEGESVPDLSNVNLSRCDLMGVDLRGACLRGTFLGGSDLDGADLKDADLRQADLPGCRLYKTDLRGADLRDANLFDAYVLGADCTDVDLRGANLASVEFTLAVLRITDLKNVGRSMQRLEKLPLDDDLRHRLAEILQKLDILDDLSDGAKQEVAPRFDDLIKALLQSPPNADKVAELQDVLSAIAPPLAAEVSKAVSFDQRTGVFAP
jgi:hypothetical protein